MNRRAHHVLQSAIEAEENGVPVDWKSLSLKLYHLANEPSVVTDRKTILEIFEGDDNEFDEKRTTGNPDDDCRDLGFK